MVAKLLNNPDKEIVTALEESLQEVFQPKNDHVLAELVQIYRDAENAFFTYVFKENKTDQYNDIILLMSRDQKIPESSYLKGLSSSHLRAYEKTMKDIQSGISSISGQLENEVKMKMLKKCIDTVISEISMITVVCINSL